MILTPQKNSNINKTLLEFAYAEYGSALEMLAAAKRTNSDKLKLGYIKHALDEYRHTNLILQILYKNLEKEKLDKDKNYIFYAFNCLTKGYVDKKGFLVEKFHLKKFVEFVYTNEFLAKESFINLKTRIKNKSINKTLDNIISEEDDHSKISLKKLDSIIDDEQKHWYFAKKFYQKKFPKAQIAIAFAREKIKNKIRTLYAKNLVILNKIFDPIIYIVIVLFGYLLFVIKTPKSNKNLLKDNGSSVF